MNNERNIKGITVAVGYGWQMFDESEPSNKDKKPKGYDVLYDEFWKSIKSKFKPKCEGIEKSLNAKISFKRLRASHGKLVWESILKNINNADVLIFDVAAAPRAKDMPKDWSNIKDVILTLNYNVLVEIGDGVVLGGAIVFGAGKVKFGNYVSTGPNVVIQTQSHEYEGEMLPYGVGYRVKDVEIGDAVWIGMNVLILPGTKIGEGAIIQAGSVVHGEIPPCAIAGGNPAKVFSWRDKDHYEKLKSQGAYFNKSRA